MLLEQDLRKKKVGTFGTIGCFSFHPRKIITTGEGGLIITNNTKLAQKISSLKNHGKNTNKAKLQFDYAGYNYRITDFQSFLGLKQFENFKKILSHHIKI